MKQIPFRGGQQHLPDEFHSASGAVSFKALANPDHQGVASSIYFIEQNWNKPIDVADLVRVARMSRRGLFKAFQRHLGITPRDGLEQTRIGHAKKLITMGIYNTSQIAKLCGYRSTNTFNVAFKRVSGVSPTKFRQHIIFAKNNGEMRMEKIQVSL